MPSVDRQRLEREIDRALSDPTEPGAVKAGLGDLFEFYGNRPRHAPARVPLDDSTRSYGVPGYVIEQVTARLQGIPLPDETRTWLVDELWSTGYSEQRRVALALLSSGDREFALGKAVKFARDTMSTPQLETLAEGIVDPMREDALDLHWKTLSGLIRTGDGNQRMLGLCALETACRDPEFGILPAVYECLQGISGECHGREAKAFARAIEAISARHPLEVVRFLEDEAGRSPLDRHIQRLLTSARDRLAHESGAGWK